MASLLIITRSARENNIQEVIGKYEFTTINRVLMESDDSFHPMIYNSVIIHVLEDLFANDEELQNGDEAHQVEPHDNPDLTTGLASTKTCRVKDGMAHFSETIQEL